MSDRAREINMEIFRVRMRQLGVVVAAVLTAFLPLWTYVLVGALADPDGFLRVLVVETMGPLVVGMVQIPCLGILAVFLFVFLRRTEEDVGDLERQLSRVL